MFIFTIFLLPLGIGRCALQVLQGAITGGIAAAALVFDIAVLLTGTFPFTGFGAWIILAIFFIVGAIAGAAAAYMYSDACQSPDDRVREGPRVSRALSRSTTALVVGGAAIATGDAVAAIATGGAVVAASYPRPTALAIPFPVILSIGGLLWALGLSLQVVIVIITAQERKLLRLEPPRK